MNKSIVEANWSAFLEKQITVSAVLEKQAVEKVHSQHTNCSKLEEQTAALLLGEKTLQEAIDICRAELYDSQTRCSLDLQTINLTLTDLSDERAKGDSRILELNKLIESLEYRYTHVSDERAKGESRILELNKLIESLEYRCTHEHESVVKLEQEMEHAKARQQKESTFYTIVCSAPNSTEYFELLWIWQVMVLLFLTRAFIIHSKKNEDHLMVPHELYLRDIEQCTILGAELDEAKTRKSSLETESAMVVLFPGQLEAGKATAVSLQSQLESETVARTSITREAEELTSALSDVKSSLAASSAALHGKMVELADKESEVEAVEKERSFLKASYEGSIREAEELTFSLSDVKSSLETESAIAVLLQSQLESLQIQLMECKASVREGDEINSRLKMDLSVACCQYANSMLNIEKMRREIEVLTSTLLSFQSHPTTPYQSYPSTPYREGVVIPSEEMSSISASTDCCSATDITFGTDTTSATDTTFGTDTCAMDTTFVTDTTSAMDTTSEAMATGDELSLIRDKLAAEETARNSLQLQYSTSQVTLAKLLNELYDTQQKVVVQEAERAAAENRYTISLASSEEMITTTQRRVEQLEKMISINQAKETAIQAQTKLAHTMMQEEHNHKMKEIAVLGEADKKSSEEHLHTLESQLSESHSLAMQNKSIIRLMKADTRSFSDRCKALDDELEEVKQKLAAEQRQRSTMESKYTSCMYTVAILEACEQDLEGKYTQTLAALTKCEVDLKASEKRCSDLREQCTALTNKIASVEKENVALQSHYNSSMEAISIVERDMRLSDDKNNLLESALSKLQLKKMEEISLEEIKEIQDRKSSIDGLL